MKLQDLKYLFSLLIPITCYFSIYLGGIFSWLTLVTAFIVVPSIETFLKPDVSNENFTENKIERNNSIYFKLLLYINLPIVYFLLSFYFHTIENQNSLLDIFGMTVSVGILLGANAINVAHELGHKESLLNQLSAKLLLIPCFYSHFTLQHNRGHHLNVGTPVDPATARFNESIYKFWVRCIPATYRQAWELENTRISKSNGTIILLKNEMIINTLLQIIYLLVIYIFFGLIVSLLSLSIGFISILLLETINYIEHYGLNRKLNSSGKYERVEIMHSWNSNHVLGRIMLYELTRHADHHFKSNKNYQMLKHYDESPQLPYGYPASLIISLIPSLWFKLINPILLKNKTILIA